MDLLTLGLLPLGIATLTAGGEALVRGASRLALSAGISPLVVGLTVVALGTSAPELVVSLIASIGGEQEIAVANVVGSNVCNVLLVLGLSAAVAPLAIRREVWRRDVPIMIGASVAVLLVSLDRSIGALEAGVLLAALAGYTGYTLVSGRAEGGADQDAGALRRPPRARSLVRDLALVAAGLVGLVLGARWLVRAAVEIARAAGLSEVAIGLTVVAVGTSLPEIATSVIAALRGARDLAVGNVVGSNVFNCLAVVGVAGLATPGGLRVAPALVALDMPFMIAASVACLPLFFTARTLARWEGALFLAYYVAYVAYLLLRSTEHEALPAFSRVMLSFVMPLTAVTIGVLTVRALRRERSRRRAA